MFTSHQAYSRDAIEDGNTYQKDGRAGWSRFILANVSRLQQHSVCSTNDVVAVATVFSYSARDNPDMYFDLRSTVT
jgi:hypothetical protein